MIEATQQLMINDGMNDSLMLIADGSDPEQSKGREQILEQVEQNIGETLPIFFLSSELQNRVVDTLVKRTHLPEGIIRKIVSNPEYDSNRLKLDALQGAMVLGNGKQIASLSLDDDVIPPLMRKIVKPEVLRSVGIEPSEPNSFIFWVGDQLTTSDFYYEPNSLRGFFDPLGKTVKQLSADMPELKVSPGWRDEMHRAMEDLRDKPRVFHVSHRADKIIDLQDAAEVIIQAVTNTKTKLPDPRTVRYIEQLLLNSLIPPEGRIFSYIAGPAKPFVFFKAGAAGRVTNVDSANMSWIFNQDTAKYVRWYPSNPEISKANGIVDWQYRSDNEWLPMFLVKLWKELHKRYAYFTGFATETEHFRAQSGYRPTDPAEAAASSLAGHEASEASLMRMIFDKHGHPSLNLEDISDYIVPLENARKVYVEMRNLQLICAETIIEVEKKYKHTNRRAIKRNLRSMEQKYKEIYESVKRRVSGRDFDDFYERINQEVREQLIFTNDVLKAYPIVMEEIMNMIRHGEYPVYEFRPARERKKNYPNGGRQRETLFKA
jgi:hypothetical protein